MPITTQDRFFGEGISSYGDASAESAFRQHQSHIRKKRLEDLLGSKDANLNISDMISKIGEINSAIAAADKQAVDDNAEFIKLHGIKV